MSIRTISRRQRFTANRHANSNSTNSTRHAASVSIVRPVPISSVSLPPFKPTCCRCDCLRHQASAPAAAAAASCRMAACRCRQTPAYNRSICRRIRCLFSRDHGASIISSNRSTNRLACEPLFMGHNRRNQRRQQMAAALIIMPTMMPTKRKSLLCCRERR